MICFRFIFILVLVLKLSDGVKVDVKGSLSLGKEVVYALKSIINKNNLSGRRSLGGEDIDVASHGDTAKDTVALIVHSSFLCRDLEFCNNDLNTLLNEYIITLTKAVESLLEELTNDADKNGNSSLKPVIFEGELRRLIRTIKKMVRKSDQKINEENESYTWIDLLKRINANFQDRSTIFAAQRLEGNVQEVTEVKTKVTQKIIIATTLVELKYINKLCNQHKICSKSYEVTTALNTLLKRINTTSDEKAKEFIRNFYETLPSTNFYYRISDVTGHEFQTILHDMAYAENISTKKVLNIINRIVENRINALTSNEVNKMDKQNGKDVSLVQVMLSDMDHFYSKRNKEPFHDFLNDFFEWTNSSGKFSSQMRRLMKDLQNSLSFESDELVLKLVNEMRTFMEITVDPDP